MQNLYPDLKKLTSTSQVSFFGLIRTMWILLVQAVDARFDAFKADVVQAIAEGQVGSIAWYVKTLKAFQFGDSVSVYDGFRVGYAVDNPAKRIVYQAAVTEQLDGRLLAKVAKAQGLSLQALNADELIALKEYIRQVKYAGVAIDVISLPPDELVLDAVIVYDRQVLNAQGKYVANPTDQLPVIDVMFEYLRTIRFDSTINLTDLTDHVQKAPGVKDFSISHAYIRAAGTSAYTEFIRETTSRAGHATLDYSRIKYV